MCGSACCQGLWHYCTQGVWPCEEARLLGVSSACNECPGTQPLMLGKAGQAPCQSSHMVVKQGQQQQQQQLDNRTLLAKCHIGVPEILGLTMVHCCSDRTPLKPFEVTPMRPVPASIQRPPYANSGKLPQVDRKPQVHDAQVRCTTGCLKACRCSTWYPSHCCQQLSHRGGRGDELPRSS